MADHDGLGPTPAAAEATTTPAQGSGTAPPAHGPDVPRSVDLVLARAHLRLGSLALARAELEILGGRGALDSAGQVDLAEVRWRTGDLSGAGAAASIAMGSGLEPPVVLAIAAETAAALGRPNEARRLANRAMETLGGPIDELFAGMPRSGVWPADLAEPAPTAGTLFHHEPPPGPSRRAGDVEADVVALRARPADDRLDGGGSSLTLGFWDPDGADDGHGAQQPDPVGELDAARAALVAGALEDATLRFGVALRLAPALAPAVLEATDGVTTPQMNLVRGDAYRLVGLETEARRAYAAAAWSGARDRRHHVEETAKPAEPGPEPEPTPAPELMTSERDPTTAGTTGQAADAPDTSEDPSDPDA